MFALSSKSRAARFRPGVESLEARELMTAAPLALPVIHHLPVLGITAQQSGTTLSVRGSNFDDRIQINDDGTRVHVFGVFPSGSYVSLGVFTNVRTVVISTGLGNDRVTYDVLGTSPLNIGGAGNFA